MESPLAPVFGAVLPVFGLVACGYLAGRFHIVTQASSQALNQFVYAFALPAMLFVAVDRGSLEEILSGAFLLAVIVATVGTALAGSCSPTSQMAPVPRQDCGRVREPAARRYRLRARAALQAA